MIKRCLFMCFLIVCTAGVYAQGEEKISIAILSFLNNASNESKYAGIMQEMVAKEFVKGNRFTILDRSKFQKVLDELKVQKSEEFLNSKVVDQGRLLGAQYLVTGVLNQADAVKETVSTYDYATKTNKYVTKYKADIRFSFQVIDVTTSSAVYAENISATNGSGHDSDPGDAMEYALCKLKKQVKNAVMKLFPQEIQIVSVEKTNKKGLPEEVLISAGSNYFDENYKKGNECDNGIGDAIVGIFSKKESVKLKVFETEILTVGGKEMKREKTIGQLKLKKVEGEFSICEVDEGEKEIKERLDGKKTLLVKIL